MLPFWEVPGSWGRSPKKAASQSIGSLGDIYFADTGMSFIMPICTEGSGDFNGGKYGPDFCALRHWGPSWGLLVQHWFANRPRLGTFAGQPAQQHRIKTWLSARFVERCYKRWPSEGALSRPVRKPLQNPRRNPSTVVCKHRDRPRSYTNASAWLATQKL